MTGNHQNRADVAKCTRFKAAYWLELTFSLGLNKLSVIAKSKYYDPIMGLCRWSCSKSLFVFISNYMD
jgi:hypothetical protein